MIARLIFIIGFFPQISLASGNCSTKFPGAHEDFCSTKQEAECQVHKAVCKWNEIQQVQMVKAEKCQAKEGKEAHDGFCSPLNKATCRVHGSLCEWH